MVLAATGTGTLPTPSSTTATGTVPLLITIGDGPWAWTKTRYTLLDGALDDKQTSYSKETVHRLQTLGSALKTQLEGAVSFEFESQHEEPEPLTLSLASYESAGVGGNIWDAGIALTLFSKTSKLLTATRAAKVLELGAGIGLPGIALARQAGINSVTLTDARQSLIGTLRRNARASNPIASVQVAQLVWGAAEETLVGNSATQGGVADGESTVLRQGAASFAGNYDVVIGSDVCYDERSVPQLASLIKELHAPLSILIGPATRPSMSALVTALRKTQGLHVDEKKFTLVCCNAERDTACDESVRSAGVHLLLVIRQSNDEASMPKVS